MSHIGVGSALGALCLLFCIWGIYKLVKRRKDIKRKKKKIQTQWWSVATTANIYSNEGTVEKTKLFNSKELQKATANLSIDIILGHGDQGTVYKGMLEDGKIIAIKKMEC